MFLVVGATGMVGGEVCRRLAEQGLPVRALVRATSDPRKVEDLQAHGVETVLGDLRDPASLVRACAGVTALLSTVSAMPFSYQPGENDMRTTDLDGARALIAAARTAGVARFVYLSFSKNLDTPCPLHDAKRAVEADLLASGLEYVILRPSCFMEVWLTPAVGFDPTAATATIYGEGLAPLSWISASDVAAFAVHALHSPLAANRVLELGGPRPISPLEAVTLFERAVGRPFTVTHVPVDALRARLTTAADPMQQSFAALMVSYANGDAIPMDEVLRTFPVPLTSVEAYAARVTAREPAAVH